MCLKLYSESGHSDLTPGWPPNGRKAFRKPTVPLQLATSTYTAFKRNTENIFISLDLMYNSITVGFKLRQENTNFPWILFNVTSFFFFLSLLKWCPKMDIFLLVIWKAKCLWNGTLDTSSILSTIFQFIWKPHPYFSARASQDKLDSHVAPILAIVSKSCGTLLPQGLLITLGVITSQRFCGDDLLSNKIKITYLSSPEWGQACKGKEMNYTYVIHISLLIYILICPFTVD